MTAKQHVAMAQLAIAVADWHARFAVYTPGRLVDARQCGQAAVRQLERALLAGMAT